MEHDYRRLARIAIRFCKRLSPQWSTDDLRNGLQRLADDLELARGLVRRIDRCGARGWHLAQRRLLAQLEPKLAELMQDVGVARDAHAALRTAGPALGTIVAELAQAEQEFSGLRYDLDTRVLSVETEPIDLEGVWLGPFQIAINLRDLEPDRPFKSLRVIALEPNAAGGSSEVTHPHVSSDLLCPGDGSAALARALQAGRVFDLFQIVESILKTYNPASAYVKLEDWDGERCADCDYPLHEDNSFWCESCQCSYCDDCTSCCAVCDECFCNGCLTQCPHCDRGTCSSCMTTCGQCENPVCNDCLEDSICPSCATTEENDDEEEKQETCDCGTACSTHDTEGDQDRSATQPDASDIGVHATGMGQALVPVPPRRI